jgi:hypothetical protein
MADNDIGICDRSGSCAIVVMIIGEYISFSLVL